MEVVRLYDSASFRVIFKTTRTGNFSNTVTAGYNDTVVSNSTNTTEVSGNNSTEDNKTSDKSNKDNKTTEKTEENGSDDKHSDVLKKEIDEKATGNPLLVLVLALILIPLRRFKK